MVIKYPLEYIIKTKLNISCVYKILCDTNGKFYIGSSKNLYKRFLEHYRNLNKKLHDNKKLQNVYNKYGKSAFYVEILEIFDPNVVNYFDIEQKYVDKNIKNKLCLNINPICSKPPIYKGKRSIELMNIKTGKIKKWKYCFLAAKELSCNRSDLVAILKGDQKSVKGWCLVGADMTKIGKQHSGYNTWIYLKFLNVTSGELLEFRNIKDAEKNLKISRFKIKKMIKTNCVIKSYQLLEVDSYKNRLSNV